MASSETMTNGAACPEFCRWLRIRGEAGPGQASPGGAWLRGGQIYSRSAAELDGGERPGGAFGVLQQLLDGDADGHHSDRVGVGLVEHGAQTLDGLGLRQGGVQGVHRLEEACPLEAEAFGRGGRPTDPLTFPSFIRAQAISSVRRTSPVLSAPLAVKSKRRRSGATREPRWSASPKTPLKAKLRMCVAVWLLMTRRRRTCTHGGGSDP